LPCKHIGLLLCCIKPFPFGCCTKVKPIFLKALVLLSCGNLETGLVFCKGKQAILGSIRLWAWWRYACRCKQGLLTDARPTGSPIQPRHSLTPCFGLFSSASCLLYSTRCPCCSSDARLLLSVGPFVIMLHPNPLFPGEMGMPCLAPIVYSLRLRCSNPSQQTPVRLSCLPSFLTDKQCF